MEEAELTLEFVKQILNVPLEKDPLIIPHGSLLYSEMFSHLDELNQKKVVEALIQHICCSGGGAYGNDVESPAAASLALLQELADNQWGDLVRFSDSAIFLLENLEDMSLAQIRKVLKLVATMAYGFSENNLSQSRSFSSCSFVQSKLLSKIQNLLQNHRSDFQRMGVLGAVTLLAVLSEPFGGGMFSLPTAQLIGDKRLQLARNLMELVKQSTERSPEVAAFFNDEMERLFLLNKLHPALHPFQTVSTSFRNTFVVDEEKQPLDDFPVKLALKMSLNTVEANDLINKRQFINIAPMTFKEALRQLGDPLGNEASVTTLVSHFRLLRNTTQSYEPGTMKDIEDLLDCALCIPDVDLLSWKEFDYLAQSDKEAVCRSLFHAINWLIEVINTFSCTEAMRAKVIRRVRDVIFLKEMFCHFYRLMSTMEKARLISTMVTTNQVTGSFVQAVSEVHFRELEHSGFLLLSTPLDLSNSSLPSSSLQLNDLEFLLNNLAASSDLLSFRLGSKSGNATFVMLESPDPLEVAKQWVLLTEHLCSHLEAISAYLTELYNSDHVVEGVENPAAEPKDQLARCFQLICLILGRIFTGFQNASISTILMENALRSLAGRSRPEDAKTAAIPELTAYSFSYIEQFVECVYTLDCAAEHARLLEVLLRYLPGMESDLDDKLAGIANGYLNREWCGKNGKPLTGSYGGFFSEIKYLRQVTNTKSYRKIVSMIEPAWNEDATAVLKFMFHLRLRFGRKLDFFNFLVWLYNHHFKTLLESLGHLPRHDKWKDLLWLLNFVLWGKNEPITKFQVNDGSQPKVSPEEITDFRRFTESELIISRIDGLVTKASWQRYLEQLTTAEAQRGAREHFKSLAKEIEFQRKRAASIQRLEEKRDASQIVSMKDKDKKVAQIYDAVVRLFSNDLKNATKPEEEFYKVGKWAPMLDSPYDRSTSLGKEIALSLEREPGQKTGKTIRDKAYKMYSERLTQLRYRNSDYGELILDLTGCDYYLTDLFEAVKAKKNGRLLEAVEAKKNGNSISFSLLADLGSQYDYLKVVD